MSPFLILFFISLLPFVEAKLYLRRQGTRRANWFSLVIVLAAVIASALTIIGGLQLIEFFHQNIYARRLLLFGVLLVFVAFHAGFMVSLLFFDRIKEWYDSRYK